MKHRFQLYCDIEPDDETEFDRMDDDAIRCNLAERLAKAIEHGTTIEALSEAARASVSLHVYPDTPLVQALRAQAQEMFNDDPCDWSIDGDAAVTLSRRRFPSHVYSVGGYVQGWVYTGIISDPQEPEEEDS
jgi:hypothetical protein